MGVKWETKSLSKIPKLEDELSRVNTSSAFFAITFLARGLLFLFSTGQPKSNSCVVESGEAIRGRHPTGVRRQIPDRVTRPSPILAHGLTLRVNAFGCVKSFHARHHTESGSSHTQSNCRI